MNNTKQVGKNEDKLEQSESKDVIPVHDLHDGLNYKMFGVAR
jgi:hypothetical protein